MGICFKHKKTPINLHNERTWSLVHPHEHAKQQEQGGEKVMALVGIVDGRKLPVFWFKDKNGLCVSVNGSLYGDMVKNHVFLPIEEEAAEKKCGGGSRMELHYAAPQTSTC